VSGWPLDSGVLKTKFPWIHWSKRINSFNFESTHSFSLISTPNTKLYQTEQESSFHITMFFSKFAAVLALATFTFALPRPHDACKYIQRMSARQILTSKGPGIVAHDGDGPCFTISRRQMDMPGMDMPSTPAPSHTDMPGMEGMHMKRHGPDGDDEEVAKVEVPKAVVPTAATTPAVVAPAPAAMPPMAGMQMKRHDACPGIVNHDGDGPC
jgi:hypothetical protein